MRLIDADELLTDPYFTDETIPERDMLIEAVEDSRTVDAVPVVRCKDCKHCRNGCQCDVPLGVSEMEEYILVDEDDFCSYGERKDGADNE